MYVLGWRVIITVLERRFNIIYPPNNVIYPLGVMGQILENIWLSNRNGYWIFLKIILYKLFVDKRNPKASCCKLSRTIIYHSIAIASTIFCKTVFYNLFFPIFLLDWLKCESELFHLELRHKQRKGSGLCISCHYTKICVKYSSFFF